MPKPVVIHNQVGVFAGPAPATGYHFINQQGIQINRDDPDSYFNLVFPINRVFQVSYGWSESRTDFKSLGYRGNILRPVLVQPDVTLSISYYLMGLINEARLGFVFNQPSGNVSSGEPIYGQSLNICPISGFVDRTYQRSSETPLNWPLTYRDSRNLFIATKRDFDDLNDYSSNYYYKSSDVDVFAFGDCFLNNYKTSASVGQFPTVTVDFVCNNVVYYSGGSGNNIPSVDPQTFIPWSGITFNLPNNFQGNHLPTTILPSDINLDISSVPSENYLAVINNRTLSTLLDSYGRKILELPEEEVRNLPVDFRDIKIQGYSIELNLNREPMYNLGYKLPLDRQINFPVFANLTLTMLVGDDATGSLNRYIAEDREYDVNIKMKFQKNTQAFSGVGIIYRFLGAKFNSISISESIQQHRTVTMSFTSELRPESNTNGFFMSGQLGVLFGNQIPDILLGDDFAQTGSIDELLLEDGYNGIIVIKSAAAPIY